VRLGTTPLTIGLPRDGSIGTELGEVALVHVPWRCGQNGGFVDFLAEVTPPKELKVGAVHMPSFVAVA